MATETISIKKQSNSNGLYFSDNEGHSGDNTITTKVKPGDTIIWQLEPMGGIDTITAITEMKKPNNQDLFVSEPAPVNPTDPKSNWTAEIKADATGRETYTIKYEIDGVSFLYTTKPDPVDDPDLEVDDDEESNGGN